MSGVRETTGARVVREIGCVLWPAGIGLLSIWLAGRFESLNCIHAAALFAFGAALIGSRFAIVDRSRACPHGVRGAIVSPTLCAMCLAAKKSSEHTDRFERKQRGRERAASRAAGPTGS